MKSVKILKRYRCRTMLYYKLPNFLHGFNLFTRFADLFNCHSIIKKLQILSKYWICKNIGFQNGNLPKLLYYFESIHSQVTKPLSPGYVYAHWNAILNPCRRCVDGSHCRQYHTRILHTITHRHFVVACVLKRKQNSARLHPSV